MNPFKKLISNYIAPLSLLVILLSSFTLYRKEEVFWDVHVQRLLFQGSALALSTLCVVFAIHIKRRAIKFNRLDLLVIAFVLYNVSSRLWLIKSHDHETYTAVSCLFIYLFVRLSSDGLGNIQKFVIAIVISCVFNFIVALLQLVGFLPTIDIAFLISGAFINPAECAGFTAATIPLALFLFMSRKETNRSSLITATCISFVLLLLLTKSRTAIISLFITAGVFYAHFYFHRLKKHFILSVCIVSFAFVSMFALYQVRLQSVNGRFLIWKVLAEMASDNVVLGKGLGYVEAKYNLYQSDYFSSGNGTDQEKMLASNNFYAFNEYYRFLIELGVFGLAIFLLIIVELFRKSYRTLKTEHDKNRFLNASVLGAVLVILLFALFSYPFRTTSTTVLFFVAIALTNSLVEMNTEKRTKRTFSRIVPFMFVVFSFLSTNIIHASIAVKKWAKISKDAVEQKVDIKAFDNIFPTLANNHSFLYSYGSVLAASGNFGKALAIFDKVKEHHNSSDLYCHIARCQTGLKRYEEAEENFKTAISMVPNALTPQFLLFDFYRTTEQRTSAREQAAKILDTPVKIQTGMAIAIKREAEMYLLKKDQ